MTNREAVCLLYEQAVKGSGCPERDDRTPLQTWTDTHNAYFQLLELAERSDTEAQP